MTAEGAIEEDWEAAAVATVAMEAATKVIVAMTATVASTARTAVGAPFL